MHRIFFALAVVSLGVQPCFAQGAPASEAIKLQDTIIITGKVESLVIGSGKNAKSVLVVLFGNDKKYSFTVDSATVVSDVSGKAASLASIKKGVIVKVRFVTHQGINQAVAIGLMK